MYNQGALSYEMRNYIAIMAAARHKCIYLVKQQEKEFLSQKGNKSWLSGFEHIPNKLRDLHELNKLLCHAPWLISQNHIRDYLKRNSVTELMMAITILTHFHALSGFVFGCGINENCIQQLEEVEKEKAAVAAAAAAAAAATANSASMASIESIKKSDGEKVKSRKKKLKHIYENEYYHDGLVNEEDDYEQYEYEDDDDYEQESLEDDEDDDDDEDNYDNENQYINENDFELTNGGEFNYMSRSRRNHRLENSSNSNQGYFRTRSDSTGTANRTLSNSVSIQL
jgi:hypothetical protein